MKVESVRLTFREGYRLYGQDSLAFNDADYPELHYMVKDGQHVINWRANDGRREGKSLPQFNVQVVDTVL